MIGVLFSWGDVNSFTIIGLDTSQLQSRPNRASLQLKLPTLPEHQTHAGEASEAWIKKPHIEKKRAERWSQPRA